MQKPVLIVEPLHPRQQARIYQACKKRSRRMYEIAPSRPPVDSLVARTLTQLEIKCLESSSIADCWRVGTWMYKYQIRTVHEDGSHTGVVFRVGKEGDRVVNHFRIEADGRVTTGSGFLLELNRSKALPIGAQDS